jgi:hypothetical protein
MPPALKSRREVRSLLIFIACFLALPALVSWCIPLRVRFDKKPIARLQARSPDIVILSDSIVDNGIDPDLLGQLLYGRRVELLWYGGASSAAWYFQFKNYVAASGIRPQLVCIFFRDRMLTDPRFRTEGTYRAKLEAAMHEDEPAYRLVLGAKRSGTSLSSLLGSIYPLDARRYAFHQYLEETSMRLVADAGLTVPKVRRAVNRTFAVTNLAGGAADEAAAVTKERSMPFDPDPALSFLPHIVETAEISHLPLCFVRVKRYPDKDGRAAESDDLKSYVAQLRAWIEGHGCRFVDDTDNSARTQDMYLAPGDDHAGPWAKKRSTELYAGELQPLLSP